MRQTLSNDPQKCLFCLIPVQTPSFRINFLKKGWNRYFSKSGQLHIVWRWFFHFVDVELHFVSWQSELRVVDVQVEVCLDHEENLEVLAPNCTHVQKMCLTCNREIKNMLEHNLVLGNNHRFFKYTILLIFKNSKLMKCELVASRDNSWIKSLFAPKFLPSVSKH